MKPKKKTGNFVAQKQVTAYIHEQGKKLTDMVLFQELIIVYSF